jgi:hypothetical protein
MTARVSGHGLLHEGRPVLVAGCCGSLDNHCQRNHYDKIGHGICSCAALSPCEDTTAARQRWHRKHKAEVLTGGSSAETIKPTSQKGDLP